MATFYSEYAQPSWQGNYYPIEAGPGTAPRWVKYRMNITAAQAVTGNIFNMVKLSANTVVLEGSFTTHGVDVHAATATATWDVGFLSDANGDGDTDDIDWFVDGAATAAAYVSPSSEVTVNFGHSGAGGYDAMPYRPIDTLTSAGTANGGYFISVKLLGTVATAGAGWIEVGMLIADKNGAKTSASQGLRATV